MRIQHFDHGKITTITLSKQLIECVSLFYAFNFKKVECDFKKVAFDFPDVAFDFMQMKYWELTH